MTREEVKREHRESEGDPAHRGERQRLHREILEQRMVEEVRKADFVVVNPEHIAVALRYDADADAAPVVVAKGERLVAERIKQIAREAGVPIFRDVGLARALAELGEGGEIPAELYEAVAEILRVVQSLQRTNERAAEPPPAPDKPPPVGRGEWKRV
jgi:flagellar biosynthetic protein FlhB